MWFEASDIVKLEESGVGRTYASFGPSRTDPNRHRYRTLRLANRLRSAARVHRSINVYTRARGR